MFENEVKVRCPECGELYDPMNITGGFHCQPKPPKVLVEQSEYERLKKMFDEAVEKQAKEKAERIVSTLDEQSYIYWPYDEYWTKEEYEHYYEEARKEVVDLIKNILVEEKQHGR